jgi:polygalacturonase
MFMNFKMRSCIVIVAALALLVPCTARAVWTFASVRSYGATGNGTTDDTAAINQAIAAGGAVYFPPGNYKYVGSMTLPANTSYRIYGDGPGVSTILFTGNPNTGIYGPSMGTNTLNVDGLTLKANSYNCGTGIYASFSESAAKFRTAEIQNVQIIGSTRDGGHGFYWTNGIYLSKAQNSVIDNVEISGNAQDLDLQGPPSQTGIVWTSSSSYATRGLHLSNLEIKYFNTALQTSGWVEGLYMNRFELAFCGRTDMPNLPVVDLTVNAPGGAQKPTFHLVNGHVQGLSAGVRFTNLTGVKMSKVMFAHNAAAGAGSIVGVNNCTDVVISQCSFEGNGDNGFLSPENGILLDNANSVRIAGNDFDRMNMSAKTGQSGGTGSCIVVQPNCSTVRIVNNLFGPVLQKYDDSGMIAYKWGNN